MAGPRLDRDVLCVVASFLAPVDKVALLRVWPAETMPRRAAWIEQEIERFASTTQAAYCIFPPCADALWEADVRANLARRPDRALLVEALRDAHDMQRRHWYNDEHLIPNDRLAMALLPDPPRRPRTNPDWKPPERMAKVNAIFALPDEAVLATRIGDEHAAKRARH